MAQFQEKRFTRKLLASWRHFRGDSGLPDANAFWAALAEDIRAKCMMVSCMPETRRITAMGHDIVAAYGSDLTGTELDLDDFAFPGCLIANELTTVEIQREPIETSGYFGNSSAQIVAYRTCHLPCQGESQGDVHILVGLSYKYVGL